MMGGDCIMNYPPPAEVVPKEPEVEFENSEFKNLPLKLSCLYEYIFMNFKALKDSTPLIPRQRGT